MKKTNCSEIGNIRLQGRTHKGNSDIVLFWGGSAVEVNVTGSELWFEFEYESNKSGSYIRIEIDKEEVSRFLPQDGIQSYCIFKDFEPTKNKNVCIFREMQANDTVLKILSFSSDGEFLPLPVRNLKIEFIGDSVTSGTGLVGSKELMSCCPLCFSSRGNYAIRVADALNADWSIVAEGGWGVYTSWDNRTYQAIPPYYEYVCGIPDHPSQLALGSGEYYDFENNHPDITIVNLGSNDASAFNNPPFIDENGISHKLYLNDNGTPKQSDLLLIENAIYNFCAKIRKYNPDTKILWCYNMLNDLLNDTIINTVQKYSFDNGDRKVYTVKLPRADKLLNGSFGHPGSIAHKMYADAILEKLNDIISKKTVNS